MTRHEQVKAEMKRWQAEHDRRGGEDRREAGSDMEAGDPMNRRVGGDRRGRNRGRPLLDIPLSVERDAEVRAFLSKFEGQLT